MSVFRRDPLSSGTLFEHHQGRVAFAVAVSRRDSRVDDQLRPMLHPHMPHVAEVRLLAARFLYTRASGSVVD